MRTRIIAACGVFLLFLGIGRMAGLALHDPMLGYANSYDMIRLQACHDIWPADKAIDITQGTPAAPLRRYGFGLHTNANCFPSAELLFTGIAIELTSLKNRLSGEALYSMRMVGTVKAAALALTALLFSLYCYRRQLWQALLANGLVMAVVLSDPGVTLYLNTFYTEFSAVYFLYVTLVGAVVAATSPARTAWLLPLLAGVAGLGLSKPQHMPLAIALGILLALWLLAARSRPRWHAGLVLACSLLSALLQASGHWVPRSENMAFANKVNLLCTMLHESPDKAALLDDMDLPRSCIALSGKNWYLLSEDDKAACGVLADKSHVRMVLDTLEHPALLLDITTATIPVLKDWVVRLFGHVENADYQFVYQHALTIDSLLAGLPNPVWIMAWVATLPLSAALALWGWRRKQGSVQPGFFLLLLVTSQWVTHFVALFGDGMGDFQKHAHLTTTSLLAFYLVLLSCLLPLPKDTSSSK